MPCLQGCPGGESSRAVVNEGELCGGTPGLDEGMNSVRATT